MLMPLAVSSAHDTLHIFKLGGNKGISTNGPSSSLSDSGATGPPDSVNSREEYEVEEDKGVINFEEKVAENDQDPLAFSRRVSTAYVGACAVFCIFEVTNQTRSIIVLSPTMPQVMVISYEGYFYLYNIDLDNGCECTFVKQYKWVSYSDYHRPSLTLPPVFSIPLTIVMAKTKKDLDAEEALILHGPPGQLDNYKSAIERLNALITFKPLSSGRHDAPQVRLVETGAKKLTPLYNKLVAEGSSGSPRGIIHRIHHPTLPRRPPRLYVLSYRF
ncbi:hypothetical protein F5887DRAFT_1072884 [Amanita rubescens]|nr:hypothetical protein F5887DRAFT_1072884 [Amanita rubescens]